MLFVGASLLAKDVNANAGFLDKRGVLWFFASKLAPAVFSVEQGMWHSNAAPSTSRCPAAAFVFSEITKWRAAWFP
ncbi:hypothetical protein [Pseudomonas sp. 24 E 13]|nr:hypothetical protein [Pseudomonas sp. 44 R 15]CRM10487.1 hypothetical protein [Pseudomonas sp. 24 E 13]CRN01938.1 hypothetical protein [Pseudomonas sp. 34 E 7]